MEEYRGLGFIVPTRNRSEMAIRSIRSVLDQGRDDVRVFVSDNCTEPGESDKLRQFCESRDGRVVHYARPDRPLSMPLHYEWALERAGEAFDGNHFAILTDRFLFRKGALEVLCGLLARWPDHVIAYRYDSVWDHRLPCQVVLSSWSGHAYRCPSAEILGANARMSGFEFVPVLLNSVINRRVIRDLKHAFGDCCQSIAPDFGCGFRTLAIEDEIIFLDRPLSFNWGRSRSNGFSFTRGVMTKDSKSFASDLGGSVRYHATPIPEITVVANAVIHEYLAVRDRTGNPKFDPVDRRSYVSSIGAEIGYLENEELKAHFRELLLRFDPSAASNCSPPAEWEPRVLDPQQMSMIHHMKTLFVNEGTRPLWWALYRHLDIKLPKRLCSNFPTQAQAVFYAENSLGPKKDEPGQMPPWVRRGRMEFGPETGPVSRTSEVAGR